MPLNVVALISGGKDSLYSLLHCIQNGHNVVALANLYPKPSQANTSEDSKVGENDDLNSFMYQTVGYSVIPLYAETLGIPLFRRQISGVAVQTGRYYDTSTVQAALDETEDLIPLLQDVINHHPHVNAVSSGAILSTYQRTRIESVALRLGLIPLAYLWQYPALPPPLGSLESLTGLLDDMEAAGCDARIIKIASGGIQDSLLWSNVANPRTKARIIAGLAPFFEDHEFWLRGAVLGEGGEYETLALNGPSRVWKKRIIVEEEQNEILSAGGGTSYVRFGRSRLVEQPVQTDGNKKTPTDMVRLPTELDKRFARVQEQVCASRFSRTLSRRHAVPAEKFQLPISLSEPATYSKFVTLLTINNIVDMKSGRSSHMDALSQMQSIVTAVHAMLSSISHNHDISPPLQASNIISSTLLLRSMSDFAIVNPIYAQMWPSGLPNPPARVTIAVPLLTKYAVSLSIVLNLGPVDRRRGLHVQSRSYWAPANIGPYSQAISVPLFPISDNVNMHDAQIPEVVHMAGQIPLVPHVMELLDGGFLEQSVLSLQHMWRVGQERRVDTWTTGVAYLESGHEDMLGRVRMAAESWKGAHTTLANGSRKSIQRGEEEEETDSESDVDIWEMRNNRSGMPRVNITIGSHLHVLPNDTIFDSGESVIPPFVAAEVISLPRNAPVEWWSTGIAALVGSSATKPKVNVTIIEATWGTISCVRISDVHGQNTNEHDSNLDDDEDNEGRTKPNQSRKQVNFISMFVKSSLSEVQASSIPKTPKELMAYIRHHQNKAEEKHLTSKAEANYTRTIVETAHGTTLISNSSECDMASMWTNLSAGFGTCTVLIPCISLWGTSQFSQLHTDTTDRSNADSTTAPPTDTDPSLRSDFKTGSGDNWLGETENHTQNAGEGIPLRPLQSETNELHQQTEGAEVTMNTDTVAVEKLALAVLIRVDETLILPFA